MLSLTGPASGARQVDVSRVRLGFREPDPAEVSGTLDGDLARGQDADRKDLFLEHFVRGGARQSNRVTGQGSGWESRA